MEQPVFRPITATLQRRVLLWAALCMLCFGGLQGWLSYQLVQQRFAANLGTLGDTQAKALSHALWLVEQQVGQGQLEALVRSGSVGHALIHEGNRVWAEAGVAAPDGVQRTQSFEIRHPMGGSRVLGRLTLSMNTEALYREVLLSVGWVLAECLALTLLLLAVVLTLLKRDLQRPMTSLARFVGELQADGLSETLDLGRRPARHRDELDLVAEGFHSLQAKIGQHIRQLDAQVAERTAQLQQALAELQTLSTTDALTGCHNRLLFNQRFPEELSRAQRYGRPLSTIFCDIDHFKAVNDGHGHGVGDAVLAAVGRCLRESLRAQVDWVVRYGGEEFVIVLPETSLSQALDTAERMRHCVEQQVRIPLADGGLLPITLSFGVAEQLPQESGTALLQRADQWLYAAKRSGRNRVQPALAESA